MRVHALAPVVAIDLDGTLGRYHDHFEWFLNTIYFPGSQLSPLWRPQYRGEFSSALGLDKATYREAKLAYRQGGLKRCMPTFPGDDVRSDIAYIRSLGIQVWITTNRPWMRLDNIDPDTRFWLSLACGEVDGIIFSQEKYHDLMDHVGRERILGVFDDLPDVISEAVRLGLSAVLRCGDHNTWWRDTSEGRAVANVSRLKDFTRYVEEWKEDWDNR